MLLDSATVYPRSLHDRCMHARSEVAPTITRFLTLGRGCRVPAATESNQQCLGTTHGSYLGPGRSDQRFLQDCLFPQPEMQEKRGGGSVVPAKGAWVTGEGR